MIEFTYLKSKNPITREKYITEDPNYADNHIYLIRGKNHKELNYKSVTTYLKDFFDEFEPDKIIEKHYKKWQQDPLNHYYNKTKEEIKKEWLDSGKKAAEHGTDFHHWVELYFNNNSLAQHTEELKEFKKWISFNKSKITPFRTELTVFSEKYKLCGNIDFITKNDDGTYNLIDWKVIKDITKGKNFSKKGRDWFLEYRDYDNWGNDTNDKFKYALQLNIYKIILEEHYGMNIKNMYNVVFYKDNPPKVIKQCDYSNYLKKILENDKLK